MIKIDLKEMAGTMAARKAAIGGVARERVERARNKGASRTPSKRALLAKLDALAQEAGRPPACIRYY